MNKKRMPRYLEISSGYRMREDYPNVAEFEVINGSTQTDLDPESLYLSDFPEYTFVTHLGGVYNFVTPLSAANPAVYGFTNLFYTYNGYTVTNNSYPGDTKLALTLDTTAGQFSLQQPMNNTPVSGDTLTLTDPTPDTFPPTGNDVYFNIQTYSAVYNQQPIVTASYYVGYYLVWDAAPAGIVQARRITQYNPALRQVVVESPFSGYVAPYTSTNGQFSIRKRPPYFRGASIAGANPKRNVITLDAGASAQNNAYNNMYIFIKPDPSDPVYPNVQAGVITFNYYVYKIKKYTGATREAQLSSAVSPELASIVGRSYEILANVQDSYSPLQFLGSTAALAETRCMSVGLITLVLPNVELTNGSRVAFYPYVYVELRNMTAAKTLGEDIIYSNNPNSTRAVFICPITDISRPTRTAFIKISASGMKQTIKFKPNDTFLFRVFLPDGTLFQPIVPDNPSPLPPNRLLQIEAVFSYSE